MSTTISRPKATAITELYASNPVPARERLFAVSPVPRSRRLDVAMFLAKPRTVSIGSVILVAVLPAFVVAVSAVGFIAAGIL